MKFGHLKVGDRVNRMIGDNKFFMEMEVLRVNEETIECTAVKDGKALDIRDFWTFDRLTGVEEDHELGWGRKFGITGTYLADKPKVN